MSRDYKSSRRTSPVKKRRRVGSTSRRRKSKRTPGWVWMLCGLGIGLIIAVATYYFMQPHSSAPATANTGTTTAAVEPVPQDTKEIQIRKEKPRFDFYTLLPKMEVMIPDSVIEQANRALPQHETNLAYVLQTGSFRNSEDAETMKAELALLGIEAGVETVVINDKETWHRVRLGPFPDMAALKPVRRQLKQNDIDFILLKMKI
jgi:cell division protein FtsN